MPLNSDREPTNQPKSFIQRLFGLKQNDEIASDREAQHLSYPPYDKGGGVGEAPRVGLCHGWRLIVRSCALNSLLYFFPRVDPHTGLNLLILMLPVAVSTLPQKFKSSSSE